VPECVANNALADMSGGIEITRRHCVRHSHDHPR
jgi:hypothetical protein